MNAPETRLLRSGLTAAALALCAASAPAQNWIRSIPEDAYVYDLERRPGGGLVAVTHDEQARPRLDLFTEHGTPQGSIVLGPAGLFFHITASTPAADGSLLVAGLLDDQPWLASVNLDAGSIEWQSTTLPGETGYFFAVERGAGVVYAGGNAQASPTSPLDGFLVRYDEQGVLQWQRKLGPFGSTSFIHDLAVTDDGGVLVSLGVGVEELLVRLDATGTLLWTQHPNPPGNDDLFIERSADGSFYLAQRQPSTVTGLQATWIARVTDAGSILWARVLDSAQPADLRAAEDGGVLLACQVGGLPGLARIDADGGVPWFRALNLGVNGSDSCALAPHPDGGAFLAQGGVGVPEYFLGRFEPGEQTAPGCSLASVSFLANVQTVTALPAPHSVTAMNWFGTVSSASTTVSAATLSATTHCGDPKAPTNFCQTAPNSVGAGARISGQGSVSTSANDLTLVTTGIGVNKSALYFYGQTPTNKPFGNGNLCVGGKKYRLPVAKSDAFGVFTHDLDLTQLSANGSILPGSTWYFQCWYRDPAGGGNGTNLSDGLTTTWCP